MSIRRIKSATRLSMVSLGLFLLLAAPLAADAPKSSSQSKKSSSQSKQPGFFQRIFSGFPLIGDNELAKTPTPASPQPARKSNPAPAKSQRAEKPSNAITNFFQRATTAKQAPERKPSSQSKVAGPTKRTPSTKSGSRQGERSTRTARSTRRAPSTRAAQVVSSDKPPVRLPATQQAKPNSAAPSAKPQGEAAAYARAVQRSEPKQPPKPETKPVVASQPGTKSLSAHPAPEKSLPKVQYKPDAPTGTEGKTSQPSEWISSTWPSHYPSKEQVEAEQALKAAAQRAAAEREAAERATAQLAAQREAVAREAAELEAQREEIARETARLASRRESAVAPVPTRSTRTHTAAASVGAPVPPPAIEPTYRGAMTGMYSPPSPTRPESDIRDSARRGRVVKLAARGDGMPPAPASVPAVPHAMTDEMFISDDDAHPNMDVSELFPELGRKPPGLRQHTPVPTQRRPAPVVTPPKPTTPEQGDAVSLDTRTGRSLARRARANLSQIRNFRVTMSWRRGQGEVHRAVLTRRRQPATMHVEFLSGLHTDRMWYHREGSPVLVRSKTPGGAVTTETATDDPELYSVRGCLLEEWDLSGPIDALQKACDLEATNGSYVYYKGLVTRRFSRSKLHLCLLDTPSGEQTEFYFDGATCLPRRVILRDATGGLVEELDLSDLKINLSELDGPTAFEPHVMMRAFD